eukprot:2603236-Prymnesium_polylepis.1
MKLPPVAPASDAYCLMPVTSSPSTTIYHSMSNSAWRKFIIIGFMPRTPLYSEGDSVSSPSVTTISPSLPVPGT